MQTHPSEVLKKAFLKKFGKGYDDFAVRELPIRLGLKGTLGAETIRKAFQMSEPLTVSDDNYKLIAASVGANTSLVLVAAMWWRLPKDDRKHVYFARVSPDKMEQNLDFEDQKILSELVEDLETARGNTARYPKGANKWFLSASKDDVFGVTHETLVYQHYTTNDIFNLEEAEIIKQEMDATASKEALDKTLDKVLIHNTKKMDSVVEGYLKKNSIYSFRFTSYFDKIFEAETLIKYLERQVTSLLPSTSYVPNSGEILELGKSPLLNQDELYKKIAESYIPNKKMIVIAGSYGSGKTLTAAISSLYYLNLLISEKERSSNSRLKIPLLIELRNEHNPNIIQLCEQAINRITKKQINYEMLVNLISYGFILPIIDGVDELTSSKDDDFISHFRDGIKNFFEKLRQNSKSNPTIILTTRENLFPQSERGVKNSLSSWLWSAEPDSVAVRISNFSEKDIQNYQSSTLASSNEAGVYGINMGIDNEIKSNFKIQLKDYKPNLGNELKKDEFKQSLLDDKTILSRPLYLYYTLKLDKNINNKALFFHNLVREYFMREWGKRANIKMQQSSIHLVFEKLAWLQKTSVNGYISNDNYEKTIHEILYNKALSYITFKNELRILGILVSSIENESLVWHFEFKEFKQYYYYRYILRKIFHSKCANDLLELCLFEFSIKDVYHIIDLLKTDVLNDFSENGKIDLVKIKELINKSSITLASDAPIFPYNKQKSCFDRLQIPFGGFDNLGSILSILISITSVEKKLNQLFDVKEKRTHINHLDLRNLTPIATFENVEFTGVPFDFSNLTKTIFINCSFNYCSFISVEKSKETFDKSCTFANIFGEAPDSKTKVRSLDELKQYVDSSMTFIDTTKSKSNKISPFFVDNTSVKKKDYLNFYKKYPEWNPENVRNYTGLDYFLYEWDEKKAEKSDESLIYVNFEASAAYAKWRGKRLPTVKEWQFMETSFLSKNKFKDVESIWHWTLDTNINEYGIDAIKNYVNLSGSHEADPEHIGMGKTLEKNSSKQKYTRIRAKNTNIDFGFRCVLPAAWLLPIIANDEITNAEKKKL